MGNRAALSFYKEHFESFLHENRFINSPSSLYEPVNYILSIGGKRFRPLLTILAFSLFDRDYMKSFPAALAVELFHNFTLVHDDIMDHALLRRGMQTVHIRFGLNKAILAGDVMLIYAYQFLTRGTTPDVASELIGMFNETAVKICEGQQFDLDFEENNEVQLSDYLRMIESKTASLIGCALAIGAVRATADTVSTDLLYSCGVDMGMAFQIKDDYLDCFGDPNLTGKQAGGDILQGKKTFPILKAIDLAGPRADDLKICYNDRGMSVRDKMDRVMKWYRELGVAEACEVAQHSYFTRALSRLEEINALQETKEEIKELFEVLYHRTN